VAKPAGDGVLEQLTLAADHHEATCLKKGTAREKRFFAKAFSHSGVCAKVQRISASNFPHLSHASLCGCKFIVFYGGFPR
jgi:hypothetical protein